MAAKNFNNSNISKTFKEVAKQSNESANTIQVKMLKNENLFDYKYNSEDIENTLDLENSIKELGFTDPIEVTDFFDVGKGNYTIISGHRRRSAGVKVNINKFPCIIKSFKNEEEVKNYALLSNSYRDSSKDPLLYCRRYKAHELYLEDSNFKGNKREEIARRLGISVQQADRYNQFNKIITPVWDMVRDGTVGMSSVLGMAVFNENNQEDILKILLDSIYHGDKLTRENCEKIIKEYKAGKKSYEEIIKNEDKLEDKVHMDDVNINSYLNLPEIEIKSIEDKKGIKKRDLEDDLYKSKINTNNIINEIEKFEKTLKVNHIFSNKESASKAMEKMCTSIELMLFEMKKISKEYELKENLSDIIAEFKKNLDLLIKDNEY